jgi:glycerol-3-phosphate dehydrogenase
LTEASGASGLSHDRLAVLLGRYGTTALPIARHIVGFVGDAPLAHAEEFSSGEMDYIARHEHIERLADIVMRRTSLAISGALDRTNLEAIATLAGRALGWGDQRRLAEIGATVLELSQKHAYRFI